MVAEERFLKSYKIHALQAVGWEGVWGLALLCTGLAVVYQVGVEVGRCVCGGHCNVFLQSQVTVHSTRSLSSGSDCCVGWVGAELLARRHR
mmetsp:Transcript_39622/g.105480  ORF Transcript_39622/g.105480 Transcript_39622/m.105480 type:complete len:91 (-) Transcript_39622:1242-1514(-)